MDFYDSELFAGMDKSDVDAILENSKCLTVQAGDFLFHQGVEGSSMFILNKGELEVLVEKNGSTIALAALKPGEHFGEICMIRSQTRSAAIKAVTDSELVELDGSLLKKSLGMVSKSSFLLLYNITNILSERLTKMNAMVSGLSGNFPENLDQSTYHELEEFQKKIMLESF